LLAAYAALHAVVRGATQQSLLPPCTTEYSPCAPGSSPAPAALVHGGGGPCGQRVLLPTVRLFPNGDVDKGGQVGRKPGWACGARRTSWCITPQPAVWLFVSACISVQAQAPASTRHTCPSPIPPSLVPHAVQVFKPTGGKLQLMYVIGSFMLVVAIAAVIASCRSLIVLWSSVSCPRSCPLPGCNRCASVGTSLAVQAQPLEAAGSLPSLVSLACSLLTCCCPAAFPLPVQDFHLF
jgi:hypothetical protein